MSVSSNSIAQFLNFALKISKTESLIQMVCAMKELDWLPWTYSMVEKKEN